MNTLKKYFQYRQTLIDQYVKGDMTKPEYLRENLEAVLAIGIKPFQNIDTVDKGLFNYHYYNALAKEAKMNARAFADKNLSFDYIEKANYYYDKKDKATLKVLQLLDFCDVTSYFITVKSKYLAGKLFEIVIIEYGMILHSTNAFILKRVKEEGIFENETKQSLIDGYINQKY